MYFPVFFEQSGERNDSVYAHPYLIRTDVSPDNTVSSLMTATSKVSPCAIPRKFNTILGDGLAVKSVGDLNIPWEMSVTSIKKFCAMLLILFAAWHILYDVIGKVVERQRRKASGSQPVSAGSQLRKNECSVDNSTGHFLHKNGLERATCSSGR